MIALIKYKNQTEYSFYRWVKAFPESFHANDMERFYKFIKTVCVFNAKKWKDTRYLKERILKEIPHFDPNDLEDILISYDHMLEFYKSPSMSRTWVIEKGKTKKGYYIERGIKNGKFYEIQKEIK